MGLLAIATILCGCVDQNKEAGGAEKEVKVGVILDQTGDLGPIGEKMLKAAELAKDELDGKEIDGKKIKVILIERDSQTQPDAAVKAFNDLVNLEGVKIIVGPMTSSETLAIANLANAKKVVVISPSATLAKISSKEVDPNNFIFRTVGSDALQGRALADLATNLGFKKIVILAINNDYGLGMAEEIEKNFKGEAKTIPYNPNAADYKAEIQQIKEYNPDAVILVGYVESATKLLKDARIAGIKAQWLSSEGIADKAMFKDPEVAEYMVGMIGTRPYSPKDTETYKKFAEAYKAKFGFEPGLFCDTTYDATKLAILAVAKAESYDGEAIKKALYEVSKDYIGASGKKTFDENGDVPQDYEIWKVVKVDGEYDIKVVGKWSEGQITWNE
ncbi:ABC transporter substrate-binding protein [Methanotorris igneus]|uniref:Extracellular ligand-binding receptor n=1 Tax=Methanotorris igneus (strain DSM 5666 / JCM 11834 / Kol 5) TaxID=880724 RepID=F6BEH5_METIK|nr:ABC transporter substrate-binding protein [Methanotorris igneus]AEF95636.1 Extracellular ligand-binding receptor [Methanotorris igneus Kol 5]